jgi:hypothetical protein
VGQALAQTHHEFFDYLPHGRGTPKVIHKDYEKLAGMTIARKAVGKHLAAGQIPNPTAPVFARPLRAEHPDGLDGQTDVA